MNKDLIISINEIKRLMEYNRSIGNSVNEQQSDIDPRLMPQKSDYLGKNNKFDTQQSYLEKKGTGTNSRDVNIFYRQKFYPKKGYFDNNMMLGEFFEVEYFDATNSNAKAAMDINEIFKDQYGWYIKGGSTSFGGQTRIYLPKDKFWQDLAGVVKSFTAYATLSDKKNKKNGVKHTLIYQLTDPEKATGIFTFNKDGETENDDPSRGWVISNFAGSQSGYFAEKQNIVDVKIDRETGKGVETLGDYLTGTKSKNVWPEGKGPKDIMLPTMFDEYTLQNYGEKYARSEFDIWYDSGWGITAIIASQILLAIATAGVGNAISAGVGATGLASTFIVLGAELSVEFAIGFWEAQYLFERGQDTGAYMCLIFSMFPIFNRLKLIRGLAGYMDEDGMLKILEKVYTDSKGGKLKTPGDLKAWLKGLDDAEREFAEKVLREGGQALDNVATEQLKTELKTGLKQILDELKTIGLKNAEKTASVVLKDYGSWAPTLKILGLNIAAIGGSIPLIYKLIEDDEEIKQNPQGFFKGVEEASKKMNDILYEKNLTKINNLMVELEQRALNPNDTQARIDLLNLLKDLQDFGSETKLKYEEYRSEYAKQIYNIIVTDMQKKYYEDKKANLEEYNTFFDEKVQKLISLCSNLPKHPFKTVDEVCEFFNWVQVAHPEYVYYTNIGGEQIKTPGIRTCESRIEVNSKRKVKPFTQEELNKLVMEDCDVKNAYKDLGVDYQNAINQK